MGANSDHYAMGVLDQKGVVLKSGFDCFSEVVRDQAVKVALVVNPSLWDDAQENFRKESEEYDGEWVPARVRGTGPGDVAHDHEVWVAKGQSHTEAAKQYEEEGNGTFFFWL